MVIKKLKPDLLNRIGLSELEGQIYSALVGVGARTLEEIAVYANADLKKTEEALQNLSNKKYIKIIEGKIPLFFPINPQILLTVEAKNNLESDLHSINSKVNDILNSLTTMIEKVTTDFDSSISTISENSINSIETTVSSIIEKLGSVFSAFQQDISTRSSDSGKTIGAEIEEKFKKLDSAFTKLRDDLENIMNTQVGELEIASDKLKTDLGNTLEEMKTSRHKIVNDHKNNFLSILDAYSGSIEEIIKETNDEIGKIDAQFKEKSDSDKINLEKLTEEVSGFSEEEMNTVIEKTKESYEEAISQSIKNIESNWADINKEAMNYSDGIQNKLADSNTNINNILKSASSKSTEALTNSIEEITHCLESFKLLRDKLKEILTNGTKSMLLTGQDVYSTIETFKSSILPEISEFMEKYKSDNQSLMENISISVKEENKNVLKNIVEDYEKEMDRLKESTESSILEGKDKFLNQFSDFQANITNQFDSGSKKIVKSITSFSSSVEKSLSRMKGDISSPLEILMTDYKDSIRNFELGFTEGINKFSELVSNFRSGAMEDKNLNKWISKNPEFQKTIDDTEAALMTQKNDLRNLVTTHTEKYEMDISGFLDILNRTLTGHIKAGQKSKTTQKEQVKSIIKEVNKEIDSLADAFKNEFAIQVESLSEASITISETSKNKVKSDLGFAEDSSQDDVYSKLIKNLINSYNEKIGEMQTESKETFIDKTEELDNVAKEKIDKFLSDIKTESNKFEESIPSTKELDDTMNPHIKKTEEALKTVSDGLEQVIGDLSKDIENIQATLSSTLNEIKNIEGSSITDLNDSNLKIAEQIDLEGGILVKNSKQIIVDFRSKILSLLTQDFEQKNLTMDKLQNSFKEQVEKLFTKYKDETTGNKERIVKVSNDHLESVDRSYNIVSNTILGMGAEPIRLIKNVAIDAMQDLTNLISQNILSIKKLLFGSSDEIKGILDDFSKNSVEILSNTKENSEKDLSTQANSSKDQLLDFRKKIGNDLKEMKGEVTLGLKEALSDVPKTINEALNATSETMNFLNQVKKIALDIQPPPIENTWRVVGLEAVYNAISSIIKRTERNTTLLVPKIDAIPVALLKGFNPRARIEIISDVKENDPHLKKLLEIFPGNLKVRSYPNLNIIAADRDNDEILIGPFGKDIETEVIQTTHDNLRKALFELIPTIRNKAQPLI